MASPPFGHCDHNAFPGVKTAQELRDALRPAVKTPNHPAHHPKPPRPAPKPYPAPAAKSAGALIGAEREAAVFVRHGRLELEHHGKVVATWPEQEKS